MADDDIYDVTWSSARRSGKFHAFVKGAKLSCCNRVYYEATRQENRDKVLSAQECYHCWHKVKYG